MLVYTHSGLRWIVLIMLVVAIVNALINLKAKSYTKKDKLINLFSMVVLHLQFILGLVLYFTSGKVNFGEGWMKDPSFRFYGMEHLVGMVLAIILITAGYSMAKRASTPKAMHLRTLIFYFLGLVLILAFIPWPFREALKGHWLF